MEVVCGGFAFSGVIVCWVLLALFLLLFSSQLTNPSSRESFHSFESVFFVKRDRPDSWFGGRRQS